MTGDYFADKLYEALYLGMTEGTFWRSTPRKIAALAAAYSRFHDPDRKPAARKATVSDLSALGFDLPKKE